MALITLILLFCFNLTAQDRRVMLSGQEVFIPKLGSKEILSAHPRFRGFISSVFNKPGSFHGPNCYNTALVASGFFTPDQIRYVSPEEFEAILKNNFELVTDSNHGDILVMDAKKSRGHAIFYLGDGLIFHKKSFGTYYHYRITDLKDAGVVEENEWTGGPFDDFSMQMNWPQLGALPYEAYRLKSSQLPSIDSKYAQLLKKMEKALLSDLKIWAIGKNWGLLGEYLLEDFLNYLRQNKTNKFTEGLVISFRDQIYLFMEEVYFKSSRSSSRVVKDICVPENKEQLFSFIFELGRILGQNDSKIKLVLEKLESQDRTRCQLRPLRELLY